MHTHVFASGMLAPTATAPTPARPPPPARGARSVLLLLLPLLALAAFALRRSRQQLPHRAAADAAATARARAKRRTRFSKPLPLESALAMLRRSEMRYVVADVKNGLGNRLRALASAMSVARALRRPVLLVWVPDLHCNCSFAELYERLPFPVLEEPIPQENLSVQEFQVYNYMRGEPGAVKDEAVDVDPDRHLYFKSAYVMNHAMGQWASDGPRQQILRLRPVPFVRLRLVADHFMVGLHVRNIFDAPRDTATSTNVTGASAVDGAEKEYGKDISDTLLEWRKASHWRNFVPRISTMLADYAAYQKTNTSAPQLQFYLAADSEEACVRSAGRTSCTCACVRAHTHGHAHVHAHAYRYTGLGAKFPDRIVLTRRQCSAQRCDFRDCRCA